MHYRILVIPSELTISTRSVVCVWCVCVCVLWACVCCGSVCVRGENETDTKSERALTLVTVTMVVRCITRK